jgi:hypothetical protein
MRKFQRVAVVAAAVAGLSAFGAGVSFAAGGEDAPPPQITAVATSTANAVATGGNFTPPQGEPKGDPQEQGNPGPEQGYGQHQGDE